MLMLIDTLEPQQMQRPISMFDRLLNLHRVRFHRFVELPGMLWKQRFRPMLRKLMGVQAMPVVRTALEAASDEVDRAYKHAQASYKTPRTELDVVIVRATDARMHFLRSGPALGWDRFVGGKIRTFDVDSEHDLIFSEPALSQLLSAFEAVVGGKDSAEAMPN